LENQSILFAPLPLHTQDQAFTLLANYEARGQKNSKEKKEKRHVTLFVTPTLLYTSYLWLSLYRIIINKFTTSLHQQRYHRFFSSSR
jgi:hypothetical protein